jgi:voltage-gated potassium channel
MDIPSAEGKASIKRFRTSVILLLSLVLFGTLGYIVIEGDTLLDALYMTIITMSTVGFGEIHRLTVEGKIFTIVLIIMSISTFAYAITTISTYLVEGQLRYLIRGYRTKSRKKMENHVIVCGFGRNGQQAVKELEAHHYQFVVIDQNHDIIVKNMDKPARFIEGDATQDETLMKANISTAKALITTMPVDADNLYVVLTARSLNPKLQIISRASDDASERKLRMAGVDNVVMPEKVGGVHMADLIARPDVVEFLEHLTVHDEDPTNLEELVCHNLPDGALNKTIYEIGIRKKTGANIIGYKTPDGTYILNPSPDTKVVLGSKLFVLGTHSQIEDMKQIMRKVKPDDEK